MDNNSFKYIIVGAGLAGASAVDGIREIDKNGTILLVGHEDYLPYNRPPLSKKLWSGKEKVQDIFIHDQSFYVNAHVNLLLNTKVTAIESANKKIFCNNGKTYNYEKILLATGGEPRRLSIPGGDLKGISYFRNLNDYLFLKEQAKEGATALVVGGGFIGSEIAASLRMNKVEVTMIFPDKYLAQKVFPENLGRATQEKYLERGIKILSEDLPISVENTKSGFVTNTRSEKKIETNMIIVGVGLNPAIDLAKDSGVKIENGFFVNEYLQTTQGDIFAAGDNANFPSFILDQRVRNEHWDNAIAQGKLAGKNMAGALLAYDYLPYFYSDLFEIGYEAVGEVDSKLETVTEWEKENEKGIIYYLRDKRIRGVMMCNVWDKVPWARNLIKQGIRK